MPEYYGHHTGFIHCSVDWPPKDDHIFNGGLPKNDHILKAPQPILQQNMEKLLTILLFLVELGNQITSLYIGVK